MQKAREVKGAYRLKPDRRWVEAFQEIDRFAERNSDSGLVWKFNDGCWNLIQDGKTVGALSAYPDFSEWMDLLESRARLVPFKDISGVRDDPTTSSASVAPGLWKGRFFPPDLFEVLDQLNSEWASGVHEASTISSAARAYAFLAFQTFDTTEVAERFCSKALALVAMSRALGGDALVSEEALLAYHMGYTYDAWEQAGRLPAGDPVGLYILGEDEELRGLADDCADSSLAAWLAMKLMAKEGRARDWASWTQRDFFRDPAAAVPLMGSALNLNHFGTRLYFGGQMIRCILAEMTSPRDQWRSPFDMSTPPAPGANLLLRFERALEALPASSTGPLITADLKRTYYCAAFFSAISVVAFHFMDGLSSPQALKEFTGYVGESSGLPETLEFLRWHKTLSDVAGGNLDGKAMLDCLDQSRIQGAGPLFRIYEESKPLFAEAQLIHVPLIRKLTARLDTRPSHCHELANLAWHDLYDPLLAQEAFGAWLVRDRFAAPTTRRWFERYTSREDAPTSLPLAEGDPSDADPGEVYQRYMDTRPDDWPDVVKAISLLEAVGAYGMAREIASDWIGRHDPGDGFPYVYAHVAVGTMYMHEGRYKESLRAVEPVVGSWVLGAVRIKALSLMRLGRDREAESIAKSLVVRYPSSVLALTTVGELYLRTGREEAFADLLKAYPYVITPLEWREEIGSTLLDAFRDEPGRVAQFCRALNTRGFARLQVGEIGEAALLQGNPRLAVEILSGIPARSFEKYLLGVRCYGILREADGSAQARQWLERYIPDIHQTPCYLMIYQHGFDDLLWDLYSGRPIELEHADNLWLVLAAAHQRQGGRDAEHQRILSKYYRKDMNDRYHKMGRYLMGLTSEEELILQATDGQAAMEIGYFAGLKAETEGRYRDAIRHYRVSVESAVRRDAEYHWSRASLTKMRDKGKSIDTLESQANGGRQ